MIKFSKYYIRKNLCKECMVCLNICPQNAIVKKNDNTLEIVQDKCDRCGLCKEECKFRAISKSIGIYKGPKKPK